MQRPSHMRKTGRPRVSWLFLIVAGMMCAAAAFGGASRADSLAQVPLRTLLPVLLAALVLTGPPPYFREIRPLLLFLAATVFLVAVTLVPLPPSIWTHLPGRDFLMPAATAAGYPQPWRPIALSPPLGWNALYSLIPPACVALGLAWLSRSQRDQLLTVLLGIITVSALLGVGQLAGGPGSGLRWYAVTNTDSAVGIFANRNHGALLLAFGFPITAWWISTAPDDAARRNRLIAGALLSVLLIVSILTTGSRGGLILGVLAGAGSAAIHRKALRAALVRQGKVRRTAMILGGGAAALAAIAVSLSPQASSVTRLFETQISSDTRMAILGTVMEVIKTHFPVGTGFGAFRPAYEAFEPDALLSRQYVNQAHNDYLQIALEGGLAACALLAAFIAWCVVNLAQAIRRSPRADAITPLTGSLILILIAIGSAVDYPVRTGFMMVVLVLAASWSRPLKGGQNAGQVALGQKSAL